MPSFGLLLKRRATIFSTAIVAIFALVVGFFAMNFDGYAAADVELNDGGVWVTKNSGGVIGHLNYKARTLDGAVGVKDASADVLQGGDLVLGYSPSEGKVNVVDPAKLVLDPDVAVPPRVKDGPSVVAMGGGVVGILDPAKGRVWAIPFDLVNSFDMKSDKPHHETGDPNAVMVVGTNGHVYLASPAKRTIYEISVTSSGGVDPIQTIPMEGVSAEAKIALTVVGDRVVVLDIAANKIHIPQQGVSVDVHSPEGKLGQDSNVKLQEPGLTAESVAYQTSTAAVMQPLNGNDSEVKTVPEGGTAAPVVVSGCSYFVWSKTGSYLRDCAGEKADRKEVIPNFRETAVLRFRVNRDVVVVNDTVNGDVWLTDKDLTLVNNWDDVTPPPDTNVEQETVDENPDHVDKEWNDENHDPVAKDDAFGARPGRSTVLPVLDNDTDQDGDVLSARAISDPSQPSRVSQIYGGRALQIELPSDATGTIDFEYEADDGRGGIASARVSVRVVMDDENTAPNQGVQPSRTVTIGGSIETNVLPDFSDAEGDAIYLVSASIEGETSIRYTQDGLITYADPGLTSGPKTVNLVVADERGAENPGSITISVKEAGTKPIAVSDYVQGVVGEPITIAPLMNDISPSGKPLALAQVDQKSQDESRGENPPAMDSATGTFTYTATSPGVYYFTYVVTSEAESTIGRVRLDIIARPETTLPPIAVRDVALVRPGQDNLINVLANDTDPNGGVLVTQSVTMPEGSEVLASVVDNESILLRAPSGLAAPITAQYFVANSNGSTVADILIVPLPAPEQSLPPVAEDDIATVRAGDYVTIKVLENDSHPSGEKFSLIRDLVELPDPELGTAFTTKDTVRFYANKNAKGQAFLTYQIVGPDGISEIDSARVTINIVERNDEANSPPRPVNITARTVSESTKRIVIPMDGIDPDGDHVSMVGVQSPPSHGRVVAFGDGYLDYESDRGSVGVDTLAYTVTDRFGARATGTIIVGIVAQSPDNGAPIAVDDVFTLRPNRTVDLSVLANDTDPDGDRLSLVKESVSVSVLNGDISNVEAAGDLIRVRTGAVGTSTLTYQVTDGRGGTDEATATVAVTEDAVLQPPMARDDFVPPSKVVGNSSVEVDVTANDLDPDGVTSELKVRTDNPTAKLVKGNRLAIQVMVEPQIIQYFITDVDDLTTSAFVEVPGTGNQYPTLKTKDATVISGQELRMPLASYVNVASGKTARLTSIQSVFAPLADASERVVDETTLRFVSREGYFGPASITFEVTDGTGLDDPEGRKAVLTIPITVLPLDNQAPIFSNNTVQVAPGEDAVVIDLKDSTKAPFPKAEDKLKYEITQEPEGEVTASLKGSKLTVSASDTAQKNARTTIGLDVQFAESEKTPGVVTVVVVDTLKPKPKANDDRVGEINQGESRAVDVLDNDFNPTPDRPLVLTDKPVVETGRATAKYSNGKLEFTPDDSYVGSIVMRYTMVDATKEPERVSTARVYAVVVGKPDQPGVPSVVSTADRQAVLTWNPPAANGAPITGYTVTGTGGGGFSQSCPATTCTLTGLTNNVEYSFRVVATNKVGDSLPSPASATVRPDVRPDTPAAPSLVFGDKSLSISWTQPASNGSPISAYTLELTPADTRGNTQKTVTGTSTVWDNLENGRPYRVRIKANNRADQPSEFSAYSRDETPAGVPLVAKAPVVRLTAGFGDQASFNVSWTAPQNNGADVTEYTLLSSRGSSALAPITLSGDQLSYDYPATTDTTPYTFRITSKNRAGVSEPSPASAPMRAASAPGPVTGLTATDGDKSATLSFSMASKDLHGSSANEVSFKYRVSGGAWQDLGGGMNVGGLANNNAYQIQVVAFATVDGSVYMNDSEGNIRTVQVQPFGKPTAPTVSVSDKGDGNTASVSWNSSGSRNGRDITGTKIQVKVGGNVIANENLGVSGSKDYAVGPAVTVEVTAEAIDQPGQIGAAANASTTVKQQGSIKIVRGTPVSNPQCASNCSHINLETRNIPAGTYTIEFDLGTIHKKFTQNLTASGNVELIDANGYAMFADGTISLKIKITATNNPNVGYNDSGFLP